MNKKDKQTIRVGKTIVEKREKRSEEVSLDTERERLRKKTKRRTVFSVIVTFAIVGVMTWVAVILVGDLMEMVEDENNKMIVEVEKFVPTVEILDENGGDDVSTRTKEYVGQLEADLNDLGVKLSRVTLPMGKMREIDVNIEGMQPYFKVNIDRGTGVSAEDIVRMKKYLEGNGLEGVSYIDVRVEGKAFYK